MRKLKSGTKNGTEVALNLLSNVIRDSNDETQFPRKLLLTDTQVSRFGIAFGNNSSTTIKLSKMVQLGGWLPLLGHTLVANLKAGAEIVKHKDQNY